MSDCFRCLLKMQVCQAYMKSEFGDKIYTLACAPDFVSLVHYAIVIIITNFFKLKFNFWPCSHNLQQNSEIAFLIDKTVSCYL